ncbi:MAG: S41 family peptidase [Gemmatimonadota bacterium]|nr:S41 family peptidase [Gemmatimonadota bacterium]MDQ8147531.1 S41 family peptidase [Gemmatimonadota bacterium]MDQ8149304.1 S41 family peptidase [Gemmatimonadota bacterium]MDQ8156269.1 S41 family peptidase [Gemmatimonadota bacterium]MDQ8176937.1 S41 family peptidase [Gemmatimonadota bacterium]
MSRPRLLALAAIALPLAVGAFVVQERATQNGARLFDQVLAIVGDRFVDSIGTGALYEKAARGLVEELRDPYSELYTPKELEAFNTTTGGFYGGIGMLIEDQNGSIMISKVYPNTPAEEAGIREGDRIIGVDTASTAGWKVAQVSDRLKGPPGTTVKARFGRPGVNAPFEVEFTRRIIRIPAIPFALMLEDKVAYIPLQQFNETTTGEFAAQLQRLQREGAKGLVIDLRRNTGGFLDQALNLANFFLPRGTELATVRGRGSDPEQYVAEEAPIAPTIPIVVLTDGYTASASEIVAGALQDHDRALIVGTTSFGKGLVQSVYRLDGGYAIKLTTGKWFTPSGRSIQKERVLDAAGNLVEVEPDSLETDAARRARPQFRSDGGRIVYGGGAITPDIIVPYDTLTTAEQQVAKALVPKSQEVYLALDEYAFSLRSAGLAANFQVTDAMRGEFRTRLGARSITVDDATWSAGRAYVDRLVSDRIARRVFGDSVAKRRDVREDVQLQRALELLRKGRTTAELLALANTR